MRSVATDCYESCRRHEGTVMTALPNGVLLTPSEVAALFGVDPKTVTRWAKDGKLSCIRTLGGHRRYPAVEVHALLTGQGTQESDP